MHEHVDDRRDEHRHADARARQRERDEAARDPLGARRGPIEAQQQDDPAEHRQVQRDLKRPDDVVAARADEHRQEARHERRRLADPRDREAVDEHPQPDDEQRGEDAVGPVRRRAHRHEEELEDRDRRRDEVLVVRLEERVEVPAAPVDEDVPLVVEERRQVAAEVQDDDERDERAGRHDGVGPGPAGAQALDGRGRGGAARRRRRHRRRRGLARRRRGAHETNRSDSSSRRHGCGRARTGSPVRW